MPQHVRRQSGCETVTMTPRSLRLSPRQQEALAQLQGELTPATPPATDDEVTLAGLDAWIAGVLSSQGQVAAKSVRYLLEQQVEATPGSTASTMVDAVVAAVSYTHLRAHETVLDLVCRLLLEKKHTPITQ